jgi:hypothetical protein
MDWFLKPPSFFVAGSEPLQLQLQSPQLTGDVNLCMLHSNKLSLLFFQHQKAIESMDNFADLRQLHSGYPTSQSTEFSLTTSCAYYETLQYAGLNGTTFHNLSGELDHSALVPWLSKVIVLSS